jgi:hypothetical protein
MTSTAIAGSTVRPWRRWRGCLQREGKQVKSGVHFLFDAVDPIAFMIELQKGRGEQGENIEALG